jgi:hypothetical protein
MRWIIGKEGVNGIIHVASFSVKKNSSILGRKANLRAAEIRQDLSSGQLCIN